MLVSAVAEVDDRLIAEWDRSQNRTAAPLFKHGIGPSLYCSIKKPLVVQCLVARPPGPPYEHAITVKFLHPCIPAPCFVFPEQEDLLDIDLSDVLSCVNATTATGRTYTLSRKEMQKASVALRARFA